MYHNQLIGKTGEEIAAEYLLDIGYKIITRNFRCKQGEIDIIAKDKYELIFIEVKTRTTIKYGKPVEAVNELKQKHIEKVIKYYLIKNKVTNINIRIDVIEVYLKYKQNKYAAKINHIKNAIE